MTLAEALVFIAQSEVGTKEEGGNNNGSRIRHYQEATTITPGPWPWCAAFVAYCLREALKYEEVREHMKLSSDDVYAWRCRDAGAFNWIEWARRKGLYITDEKELAKAGDIVVFDFSHIGIVVKDQEKGSNAIYTIEGNTNDAGARDSATGDGVCEKKRHISTVRNYIRIV